MAIYEYILNVQYFFIVLTNIFYQKIRYLESIHKLGKYNDYNYLIKNCKIIYVTNIKKY